MAKDKKRELGDPPVAAPNLGQVVGGVIRQGGSAMALPVKAVGSAVADFGRAAGNAWSDQATGFVSGLTGNQPQPSPAATLPVASVPAPAPVSGWDATPAVDMSLRGRTGVAAGDATGRGAGLSSSSLPTPGEEYNANLPKGAVIRAGQNPLLTNFGGPARIIPPVGERTLGAVLPDTAAIQANWNRAAAPVSAALPQSTYDPANPRQVQLRTGFATEVDPASARNLRDNTYNPDGSRKDGVGSGGIYDIINQAMNGFKSERQQRMDRESALTVQSGARGITSSQRASADRAMAEQGDDRRAALSASMAARSHDLPSGSARLQADSEAARLGQSGWQFGETQRQARELAGQAGTRADRAFEEGQRQFNRGDETARLGQQKAIDAGQYDRTKQFDVQGQRVKTAQFIIENGDPESTAYQTAQRVMEQVMQGGVEGTGGGQAGPSGKAIIGGQWKGRTVEAIRVDPKTGRNVVKYAGVDKPEWE